MATKQHSRKEPEHDEAEEHEADEHADHDHEADEHADHGHEADEHVDHEDEDEDEGEETEDPTWWAPHLVMVTLLLFGLGSMLGLFNKWLVPLVTGHAPTAAAHGDHGAADHGKATEPATAAGTAKPAAAPAAHGH